MKTLEDLRLISKPYNTLLLLKTKEPEAYRDALAQDFLRVLYPPPDLVSQTRKTHEVSNKLETRGRKVYWTPEKIEAAAHQFQTRSDFMRGAAVPYNRARKLNILDEVCSHMLPIKKQWTLDHLKTEALRYRTRGEFSLQNVSAYNAARNKKCLSEICKHMKRCQKTWTFKNLKKEAQKFKTRTEFKIKSQSAYNAARKNNYLELICDY